MCLDLLHRRCKWSRWEGTGSEVFSIFFQSLSWSSSWCTFLTPFPAKVRKSDPKVTPGRSKRAPFLALFSFGASLGHPGGHTTPPSGNKKCQSVTKRIPRWSMFVILLCFRPKSKDQTTHNNKHIVKKIAGVLSCP